MALRSLRALTLAFLLAFLTVTLLTAAGIFMAGRNAVQQLVDHRIARESLALMPRGVRPDPARLMAQITALARDRDTGDLGLMLTDRQGRAIAGNIHILRTLPVGYTTLDRADGIAGLTQGRALVRDIGGGLRLTVAAETEPVDHYNAVRLRIYLIGFGSIIAVVIGATLLFARAIRWRIVAMRVAVEAIIDGDMARRVPVDGSGSAFDQQARAFNLMLDRIGGLMDQIGNISNDIAHELRTPLARLRQRLDLMAARPDAAPLHADLDAAIGDAAGLLAMFTALLRIAEVEGGARRAAFVPLSLGVLCAEIVAMMEPVATDGGHRLTIGRCDDVEIVGDRQLLTQMIVNLIENGLRHTPVGSNVGLTLTRCGGQARLKVADDGPGIAAEDRARALTRFGRGDPARQDKGHGLGMGLGMGLGLPLVDAIVRLHRGEMRLDDAGPGLAIDILLPVM